MGNQHLIILFIAANILITTITRAPCHSRRSSPCASTDRRASVKDNDLKTFCCYCHVETEKDVARAYYNHANSYLETGGFEEFKTMDDLGLLAGMEHQPEFGLKNPGFD
jgi:hypothetical protein